MPVLCNVIVDKDEIEQLKDLQLDFAVTVNDLQDLVNQTMNENGNDDVLGFNFYVNDVLLTKTLGELVYETKTNLEQKVMIRAIPQEKIQVSTLTRCSASLPGHEDSVLCLSFSPCSRYLASGSGDKTVRIWDVFTGTCSAILRQHDAWVLALRFSPDGSRLLSADHQGCVCVWSRTSADSMCNWVLLHKSGSTSNKKRKAIWITSVVWYYTGEFFFAGMKDGGVRFYDKHGNLRQTLSCSSKAITSVSVTLNHLVVGSEDCHAYVYSLPSVVIEPENSKNDSSGGGNQLQSSSEAKKSFMLLHTIKHAHWVNSVSSNQDFYMRYGMNGVKRLFTVNKAKIQEKFPEITDRNSLGDLSMAKQRIVLRHLLESSSEVILTASDDFTIKVTQIFPSFAHKSTLTGHTRQINQAIFSPNNHFIASCSFDRTVRIWTVEGKLIQRFQTHASEVYQIVFSSDSRLLLSGGKDSTCKLYSVTDKKLLKELPGHQDEVYCVDWSLDGEFGASGSKDRMVKLWRR